MRTSLLAAATAVAGLLGAACADDDAPDRTGPLALYRGEPNGDNSLTNGLLELESGCLYVTDTAGVVRVRRLIVFAEQVTSWDPERQAVVRKGAKPLLVGTTVTVGGSEASRGALESFHWKVRPAATCDSTRMFVAGDD